MNEDWNGDGAVDPILRAEPGQDPAEMLVLIDTADGGRELWVWEIENDRRYQVLDDRLNLLSDYDSQPLCDVRGTSGDDVLVGSTRRELICGLAGDDVIKGLGGNDVIFGHGGNDRIVGGAGQDIVVGNARRDRCDRDEQDHSRVC